MESSLNLLTSRQKDELIQFPAAVSHYRCCGSGCNGLKCCHPEQGGGWREMGRVISGRFSRLIAGLQGHRGNKRRRFQYYKGPLAFCIIHIRSHSDERASERENCITTIHLVGKQLQTHHRLLLPPCAQHRQTRSQHFSCALPTHWQELFSSKHAASQWKKSWVIQDR